jgi:hypothetical protein
MCRELIKIEEEMNNSDSSDVHLEEFNKEAIKEKIRQSAESTQF